MWVSFIYLSVYAAFNTARFGNGPIQSLQEIIDWNIATMWGEEHLKTTNKIERFYWQRALFKYNYLRYWNLISKRQCLTSSLLARQAYVLVFGLLIADNHLFRSNAWKTLILSCLRSPRMLFLHRILGFLLGITTPNVILNSLLTILIVSILGHETTKKK